MPFRANGSASMVHDAIAMLHAALIVKADTMLVLGYSGAWFLPVIRALRPRMRIVTNVDGMEWRREKFARATRLLLRVLEWFAVHLSHEIIADNAALVEMIRSLYGIDATMIAYGGDHTLVAPAAHTAPSPLPPGYALSVARIEPENNSHVILAAFAASGAPLLSIGNWSNNEYGRRLKQEYGAVSNLVLIDPVYDLEKLSGLRTNAGFYVHGHSVGGTNPSLVEAIFHHERILAFDCVFNRASLGGSGGYFQDEMALRAMIGDPDIGLIGADALQNLRESYLWNRIVKRYVAVTAV